MCDDTKDIIGARTLAWQMVDLDAQSDTPLLKP